MGAREPLLYPIGPRDLEFPLESDLTICETSSPDICESSSPNVHDLLDVKFPLNEVILETLIMDGLPWEYMHRILFFLPELENLSIDY
jgi:hypothetical protein